jgi:RNA polymerase sigma-70 factor (ECF subfamily)
MAEPDPDEFALLEAWRAGDGHAGDRLFERHFAALFRFFCAKVDAVLAEDLVQTTLLACVDGKDRFRELGTLRAYLFSIARNQLFMHFRKQGVRDRHVELGSASVADLGASPSAIAVAKDEQRLLFAALRDIPLDFQIAVELYYWEGLSTREIAAVLGVPEGTVRSRLTRAREHLEEKMRALAGAPELAQSVSDAFEQWARSLRDVVAV